jgi:hypothetical protein
MSLGEEYTPPAGFCKIAATPLQGSSFYRVKILHVILLQSDVRDIYLLEDSVVERQNFSVP